MRTRTLVAAFVLLIALPGSAAAEPLQRLNVPTDLKVISYYPVDAGWTEMWTKWEPDKIAADLDRAVSLHANTVRAIVQPDTFGYPHPSPVFAGRLQQFVDLAGARGLHVQLTLFDWWYSWWDRRGSQTWLRELLTPYVRDPRIAFVELRNEILPKPETIKWAAAMIKYAHRLLPGTPVTLSVAARNPLRPLAKLKHLLGKVRPDFFDLHYFGGGGETAYSVFAAAKALVAPTPLWIGETGYPTTLEGSGYGGVPRTESAQEAAQTHFLATTAWAARANGLAANGIWVLNDFVPSAVPNHKPELGDPDLHYGLFRVDGTEKPAASTVRDVFSDQLTLGFNNGFEDSVASSSGELVPAEWEMHGANMSFADDATTAATGSASGRMTPNGIASGSFSIVPPDAGVRQGDYASVTAWARRADPAGKVFAVLEWTARSGRVIRRDASVPLPSGFGLWSQLYVSGVAPRNAAYVRIDLVGDGITNAVWFDDVSFVRD